MRKGKQMGKTLSRFCVTMALAAAAISFPAMAAGWTSNSAGKQVYENDDGSIVVNSWIKATENGNQVWYYATNDGSLRTNGWQRIGENFYYFDAAGIMQTGWVDNNNYYCDPNTGAMKTGWKQLSLPEDAYYRNSWTGADTYWFYFNTKNGEKFHSEDNFVVTKTIDGAVYGFDENGAMVTGWAETETSSPEITGYMYFAEKNEGNFKLGQRVAGTWYATVGPESDSGYGSDSLSTGDVEWFYFKSNGHPAAGRSDVYDVQKIDGKRFLFNERGNPVYGIQKGSTSSDDMEYFYYCGSSRNECSVKTGKMNITEDDGEKITCYFETSGKGYTGIKNGSIYFNGKLQKADSDMGYQKIDWFGTTYVVSSSGQIMKNKKNGKDKNGVKFTTDASGELLWEEDGILEILELTEPQITDIS